MSDGGPYPPVEGDHNTPPYDGFIYRPGGANMLKTMHAMFVGQGASGLAQDRIVNGFTFRHATETGALEADDFTEVRAAVTSFYESIAAAGTQTAQGKTLGSYISPWISRTAELRLYDMSQAKPRVPITSVITLGSTGAASGLPEECCCCLSFRTDLPNTGRRRGRIYFGPLVESTDARVAGDSSGPNRVASTLMTDLLKAANRLSLLAATMRWITNSAHDSDTTLHPVKFAWVDDALDTQRRRGQDAGTRTTMDLAQPS